VVDQHGQRKVWTARLAAPAAFFGAAIALILLVQRGLDSGDAAGATTTPVITTPTTPTESTTTAARERRIYRVRRGDTLESIAEKFDTTVDDLLQLNPNIDPLALSPGQKIRVS
jgi:LysM repeat protein